jgi:hypothetical protein
VSVDGNANNSEEALVMFDVSGITGSVQSATLRVYVTNATSNGPEIIPTTTDWEENVVTWNDKPAAIGGVIFDAGSIPSGAWYEFDVTSWVTGNGAHSFNLVPQSNNGLNFDSREAPATAPELVVIASSTPDSTPPTIVTTTPLDGAVDVPVSPVVTAVFSERMDSASINTTSFTLTDGGSTVAATVTYDIPTMTATLAPVGPLNLATSYTATVSVAMTDLAGNALTADTDWVFTTEASDTVAPDTSISTGPTELTVSTSASFTFISDESSSTFECALDGGSFTSCTSPEEYVGLAVGAHNFEVQATDASSNTDPTPAAWSWTITADSVFLSVADTYVNGSRQTSNYGNRTEVISDSSPQATEGLIRFDVTGVTEPVQSATLRVYVTNGTSDGPEIFLAENTWDESTVTWATKPTRLGGATLDAGAIAANSWYEFDVTAVVGGTGTYTFNLASISSDALKFSSREVSGFEPRLVISSG